LLRPQVGVIAVGAIVAGCLFLTHSRTGLLAALGGAVLLVLYGRGQGAVGRWLGWKIPAILAAGLIVISLGIVGAGQLESQAFSGAQISVLYRLQYWEATARMIADYPLLGCGPGQFQELYARYKLPEASETVADPHNFLIEVWATAGTPALVALLAMALAFAWQCSRGQPTPLSTPHNPRTAGSRLILYCGGLAGLTLGVPLALVAGYPSEMVSLAAGLSMPTIWLIGAPAAAICVWLLDPWVERGELPPALPIVALLALLANLLAAGAVSFPGVFVWAWVLVAVALVTTGATTWTWAPPRGAALGLMAASLLLAFVCMRTGMSPVLTSSNHAAAANELLRLGRLAAGERELVAAAQADPWSPQPWQSLASLRLSIWTQTRQQDDWEQFQQAAHEYQARNPRHHVPFSDQGNWLLLAWRTSGDPQHLNAAIEAYRQAVSWYPGRALAHAQLAWALHLAGHAAEAAAQAEEAHRLNDLNPHRELKLSQQMIYDPSAGTDSQAASGRNAEQVVSQLRTSIGPENQP
jgi:tetratricopeptide (TPR) repeat protein